MSAVVSVEIKMYCPNCGEMGHVVQNRHGVLYVECPCCGRRWKSSSEICPRCGKPNGYLVEGLCKTCYSELR